MKVMLFMFLISHVLYGNITVYEKDGNTKVEVIDDPVSNKIVYIIPYSKRTLKVISYVHKVKKSVTLKLNKPFLTDGNKELILMKLEKLDIVNFFVGVDKSSLVIYPADEKQEQQIIKILDVKGIKKVKEVAKGK